MAELWECDRLKKHEGMILMPYYCPAGKLTIGVGRNLEDNPLTEEERRACGDYMKGITPCQADMLLRNDIDRCKEELAKHFDFYKELDNERKYALLDMCFQLGIYGLKKFRNMIKYMKRNNFEMAAFECLHSKYAAQTPKRAKRIATLIKTGKWEV